MPPRTSPMISPSAAQISMISRSSHGSGVVVMPTKDDRISDTKKIAQIA
ncbi:MAG: hypothetical protein ACD_54C00983G0001 [uncultured bacterium]|nr:MAG: hypothetical protein ACD_54C00983G0001 [uncultured bacterium]